MKINVKLEYPLGRSPSIIPFMYTVELLWTPSNSTRTCFPSEFSLV